MGRRFFSVKRAWACALLSFALLGFSSCAQAASVESGLGEPQDAYASLLRKREWEKGIAAAGLAMDKGAARQYEAIGASLCDLNGDGVGELFFAAALPGSAKGSGSGYPDMISFIYTYAGGKAELVKAVRMSSDGLERGSLFSSARQRNPRRECVVVETSRGHAWGGETNRADYYYLAGKSLVKISSVQSTVQPKSRYPAEKVRRGLPWTLADFSFFPAWPGWDSADDPYVIVWEMGGKVASSKECLNFVNRFVDTGGIGYGFLKSFIENYGKERRYAPEPAFPWPAEEEESPPSAGSPKSPSTSSGEERALMEAMSGMRARMTALG
jgi:hypothetical protein